MSRVDAPYPERPAFSLASSRLRLRMLLSGLNLGAQIGGVLGKRHTVKATAAKRRPMEEVAFALPVLGEAKPEAGAAGWRPLSRVGASCQILTKWDVAPLRIDRHDGHSSAKRITLVLQEWSNRE